MSRHSESICSRRHQIARHSGVLGGESRVLRAPCCPFSPRSSLSGYLAQYWFLRYLPHGPLVDLAATSSFQPNAWLAKTKDAKRRTRRGKDSSKTYTAIGRQPADASEIKTRPVFGTLFLHRVPALAMSRVVPSSSPTRAFVFGGAGCRLACRRCEGTISVRNAREWEEVCTWD